MRWSAQLTFFPCETSPIPRLDKEVPRVNKEVLAQSHETVDDLLGAGLVEDETPDRRP